MRGVRANRYSLAGRAALPRPDRRSPRSTPSSGGGEDILGLDKQPARWPLPEFAVPAAAGHARRRRQRRPGRLRQAPRCPARKTRRAARLPDHDPGAIRVCDLFDRPLVISFWFGTEGGCERQQDVVSSVCRRYRGRVNFLSLDVRDIRGTVRELIREHGWKMPVGFDRDGAVGGALPGRRLPDLRLRLSGRHPAERQHRRT